MTPDAGAAPAVAESPELFAQLGHITRQLHESLRQLGVMPQLQDAAEALPDARSRLEYVAAKTGQAAERVLSLVDDAKAEGRSAAALLGRLAADGRNAADGGAAWIDGTAASLRRIDALLTEIMLAQDFHDLTGQVVCKVVLLAAALEDSLVKLLLQAAPRTAGRPEPGARLHGPVVDAQRRDDVVKSQSEVDDLLASLGF